MKKLFSILLASVVCIAVIAPAQKADAQVVYSRQCCDNRAVVRCVLSNWTPVGYDCYCYGQGWGYVC